MHSTALVHARPGACKIVPGSCVARLACLIRPSIAIFALLALLVTQLLSPDVASALSSSPQQRQPLGSLSSAGEVLVNDLPAPAESTIFAGDTLRTGPTGIATFALSGKGTLKVSPRSEVVFAAQPRYLAELKSGTVIMSSFRGATGITLRSGSHVVVPAVRQEETASKIEAQSDGSFSVSCLDGSVGVLPLQGPAGVFLQAGQFVTVSPQGQLSAVSKQPPPAHPAPIPATTAKKKSRTGWIVLALAGGGAAAAGAALAGRSGGGGGQSAVSPSGP